MEYLHQEFKQGGFLPLELGCKKIKTGRKSMLGHTFVFCRLFLKYCWNGEKSA